MVSQIWNILNGVRGFIDIDVVKEPLLSLLFLKYLNDAQSSAYDVTFVHLEKEAYWNYLREQSNSPDFPDKLNKAFHALEISNNELQGIFSTIDFVSHFKIRKSVDVLRRMFHGISEIDIINSESEFGEIFDELLYYFAQLSGKKGAEAIQPKELTVLMQSFMPVNKTISIYNPFAGYSSLAVGLPDNSSYYGQEINRSTWAIAKMRLLAHKASNKIMFECEDSILNWRNSITHYTGNFNSSEEELKYDFIVGTPPFGMRLKDLRNYSNVYTEQTISEAFFVEQSINTLNNSGSAVITTTHGFLFRGAAEKKLRETLVKQDLLEYVIGLPAGLFSNTGIPVVLIVLNKAKKNKKQVHFIDASNMVLNQNSREKKLDVNGLLSLIERQSADIFKTVSVSDIEQEDFNLNIPRYFIPEFKLELDSNEELVKLGNLIEIFNGNGNADVPKGKFVKISHLKDDNLNYQLDFDSIDEVELPRHVRKIEESCLLISLRTKSIKPTFFSFSNTPIYISNDIIAVRINNNKVTLPYLINEFHSEYVTAQIDSYRTGAMMPTISRKDLLNVEIKLLTLKGQQEAKIKGIHEAYLKQKEKDLAYERRVLGLQEETHREFASIKHTFRQYLSAMSSNVKGTRKFISKNEGKPVSLDAIYSKNLNQTFGEHLISLEETIHLMSSLIRDFGDVKKNQPYKFVNIEEIVRQAQGRFECPERFAFEELDVDRASFIDDEGNEIEAQTLVDEDDFNIVFSNIISNAKDHGFKDLNKTYKIRTALSFDADSNLIILEISNNGVPAPSNFSQKDLTTRGEKTSDSKGAGTGGADIKDIISNFQGEFEWLNNPSDDFPITYIVRFPLYKNVATL
jgi:type I restriction enzyme M protein